VINIPHVIPLLVLLNTMPKIEEEKRKTSVKKKTIIPNSLFIIRIE